VFVTLRNQLPDSDELPSIGTEYLSHEIPFPTDCGKNYEPVWTPIVVPTLDDRKCFPRYPVDKAVLIIDPSGPPVPFVLGGPGLPLPSNGSRDMSGMISLIRRWVFSSVRCQ
jgi:hypothetical protein